MINEKEIKQSRSVINQLIKDGVIMKPEVGYIDFFIKKSEDSLKIAKILLDLPNAEDISYYMWVINCSYYSMFYAALALLGRNGHKIRAEVGIHKTVYHALIYYFIDDNFTAFIRFSARNVCKVNYWILFSNK